MEIFWTETGLITLEEISDYIAKDSPLNADRFIREIVSKADLLINTPRIGNKPPELEGSEILQLLQGDYKILYKISDNIVNILAVIHGKRDFARLRSDLNI